MDFSRFNQAEQAQIAAMIEHKQVKKKTNKKRETVYFQLADKGEYYIDEGFHEAL